MLSANHERKVATSPRDPSRWRRPSRTAWSIGMWPISTRVNKPENDDPSIAEPIELAHYAA